MRDVVDEAQDREDLETLAPGRSDTDYGRMLCEMFGFMIWE